MSKISIQLDRNDLEKYLLDANGNIKLEIGNAIVQEFTKRHLKGLAEKISNETLNQEFKDVLKDYIVSKYKWGESKTEITIAGREAIHKCVEWHIRDEVKKAIAAISNGDITKHIEETVKLYVQYSIEQDIHIRSANISKAVQKAINKVMSGEALAGT